MIKSKIAHLRKLFGEDEDRYYPLVPKRYTEYCEDGDGSDMPVGLLEKQSRKFRFYFTKYPNLRHTTRYIEDMDGPVMMRHSSRSFGVASNSIQAKLYERFYGGVADLDNKWFEQNDTFIKGLALRYKLALVAMTNKSQQHIQAFLKDGDTRPFKDRVRAWRPEIYGYLPIFYPLYEKHIEGRAGSLTMVDAYHRVVRDVCPALRDDEIEEALIGLLRDIRHIFSLCPKTTKKMVLWRGLRSTPSAGSYSGFTSMSLDPLHTLRYTSGGCCLQRVVVLPRTPLLFIGGLSTFKNELECVLPDGVQLYELWRTMAHVPIVREMKGVCPTSHDTRRILIQSVVVV